MTQLRTFVMLALAFAAGVLVSRIPATARAATAPVVATSIDLNQLTPADLPTANPLLPNLRSKVLAQVDSTVFSYAIGSAPKHTHAGTTEVQLPVSPGTFIVIPPNTAHSGFTGGPFRLVAVKTPPQDPSDYHMLP